MLKDAPDFARLRKVLLRQGEPDRVPFYELFADNEIMAHILGRPATSVEARIEFQTRLGYDYVTLWAKNLDFPTSGQGAAQDTAALSRAARKFNLAAQGVIRSWQDFDAYPWPDPYQADYAEIDEAAGRMPDGMKAVILTGHVLEVPMILLGFEGLSLLSYDQPDLVAAVFDKVGRIFSVIYGDLATMDAVGAVLISDDLGFKTQTMMPPAFLRRHVFPWYRDYAATCHAGGKPVILHSCGNLAAIMDDLVACGIDAKHSFEDQILPVWEAKREYGKSLAMLGGMDMDFLCRATPAEVRARTRELLERCMPGGGYALGTGNSVANYVPVENYLAMLEEGRSAGVYGAVGSSF